MLHYALRDEKLGRKYFSWAQSEQGNIWKQLLTDNSPQYVELQSGRLFNQNLLESINTPYKQFLFTPFGTDEWNEYWLPFSQIGNVDDMTLRAAVNVEKAEGKTSFGIYPYRNLTGKLSAVDTDGKLVYSGYNKGVGYSYCLQSLLKLYRYRLPLNITVKGHETCSTTEITLKSYLHEYLLFKLNSRFLG